MKGFPSSCSWTIIPRIPICAARPLLSSRVLKSIISCSLRANGPNPTGNAVALKSPGKDPSFCFQANSNRPAVRATGIKFSAPMNTAYFLCEDNKFIVSIWFEYIYSSKFYIHNVKNSMLLQNNTYLMTSGEIFTSRETCTRPRSGISPRGKHGNTSMF